MAFPNKIKTAFWVALPRSWYRAQKPLKPGNTKKIRKNYEIPHPGSGPENTKKIQKKYKNGDFWAVFVFFLYFFRIFGARPGVGDFVIFSYFFRISGLEGFLSSIPGTRNRKFWDDFLSAPTPPPSKITNLFLLSSRNL